MTHARIAKISVEMLINMSVRGCLWYIHGEMLGDTQYSASN